MNCFRLTITEKSWLKWIKGNPAEKKVGKVKGLLARRKESNLG